MTYCTCSTSAEQETVKMRADFASKKAVLLEKTLLVCIIRSMNVFYPMYPRCIVSEGGRVRGSYNKKTSGSEESLEERYMY